MRIARIHWAVIAALVVSLITATSAPAASPAVGSASTDLSVLSLTVNDEQVGLGAGSGAATTESEILEASMSLVAAQVGDAIEQGAISVNADSSSPDNYDDSETDAAVVPLSVPGLVSGSVTLAAASAKVDPAVHSALAALAQITIDADLADGLVTVNGLKAGVSDGSSTPSASAAQGAEIDQLAVIPLSKVFELTDLSVEDIADLLIAFAADYGGEAVADELAAVDTAREDAIDDVNEAIDVLDPTELLPRIATTATAQDLIDFVEECETTFAPLGEPTAALLCSALDSLIGPLLDALEDLLDALGLLTLLGVDGMEVGVGAEAFDDHAEASSLAEIAKLSVLGLEFPVSPDALTTTLGTVTDTLSDVVDDLSALTGLHIDLSVKPLSESTSTGKDGAFHVGTSSLSALEVEALVSLDQTSDPLLDSQLRVMSLNATARHRPAVADGGGPDEDLATTGFSPLLLLGGVALILTGMKLRRWLGDAA